MKQIIADLEDVLARLRALSTLDKPKAEDPDFPGLYEKPGTMLLGMDDEMPFGKYRGRNIRSIDRDYLKWVHENVDRVRLDMEVLEYALEPPRFNPDDDIPF